jgi:hypothetical protein
MTLKANWGAITLQSATLTDFGPDAKTGMKRFYNHSTFGMQEYVLVKNGNSGTIADGLVCKLATSQTTTGRTTEVVVLPTSAATSPCYCVNNTGSDITDTYYFWGLTGDSVGYGKGGTIGDGLEISPAANGLIGAASGATDTLCGVTISDVTTDVQNKIHWNLPASGPGA